MIQVLRSNNVFRRLWQGKQTKRHTGVVIFLHEVPKIASRQTIICLAISWPKSKQKYGSFLKWCTWHKHAGVRKSLNRFVVVFLLKGVHWRVTVMCLWRYDVLASRVTSQRNHVRASLFSGIHNPNPPSVNASNIEEQFRINWSTYISKKTHFGITSP